MLQPKVKKAVKKKSTNPADSYPSMKDARGNATIGGGEGTTPPFTRKEMEYKKKMTGLPRGKMGKTVSKAKNGKSFPDLNKDGKITKADILKGRGVIAKKGATIKKAQYGGKAASMVPMKMGGAVKKAQDGDYIPGLAERAGPMVKTKTKVRSPDGNYVTKKVTTNKPNSKNSTTKTRRTLQGFITGAPRVNDLKNGGKMAKCKYGCN